MNLIILLMLLFSGCDTPGYAQDKVITNEVNYQYSVLPDRSSTITWEELDSERAIRAIIGEAEGESFKSKLAHGCAIRNRGSFKGVYGEHAPRVINHRYSDKVEADAIKAWYLSADETLCQDLVKGADGWGSEEDIAIPGFLKGKKETVHIGHTHFFIENYQWKKERN